MEKYRDSLKGVNTKEMILQISKTKADLKVIQQDVKEKKSHVSKHRILVRPLRSRTDWRLKILKIGN